jgi:hypothetical protein
MLSVGGTRMKTLPNVDLDALDEQLLDKTTGRIRLMPAAELLAHGLLALQAWCVARARYQLVTTELIEWLKPLVHGRRAIEIGAGMGDLGHYLGIPMTDSAWQVEQEADTFFALAFRDQAPTNPPPDVERIDAEAAVAKYKPDIVVGCWITQKWHEGDDRGSVHGVEEIRIVRAVDCYVHIGNHRVHSFKRILRLKHKERRAPWIVSRAFEPEENIIWTWGR